MKTHLLSIPSKKTDDVSWTKPLNNYLLSVYGNTSEYQQDLTTFNKLRQDIRGVHADLTGVKLYFKYYSQLELLDLRISFASANKHKKITFTWYDAFHSTSSHKQFALPFEKACVLFNLGALLSKYGVSKYEESQRNSTPDDAPFKEAVQSFQQSAGVYQFLNENFLHAPSPDLHLSTVKFLTHLNLAQSQEIFTLKVIDGDLEQKKNSLIAKLCRSTANYYEECYNVISHLSHADGYESSSTYAIVESGLDDEQEDALASEEEEESTNDYDPDANSNSAVDYKVKGKIDDFWIATIHFKLYYYKSLAFYFQALQLESTNKFGNAIAHFSKSSEIINEIPAATLKAISKGGSGDAYELLDSFKYQKDALSIKLKDLNKDNDLIYHEMVPSLVTLPDIKPMDSAKTIPMNKVALFNEINENNYNNFLKNVVPINIHELLSYYSEEKSQLLRNEIDEVDVSNEELSSVLEYLKMPKAVVNLKELISNSDGVKDTGRIDLHPDAETTKKVDDVAANYPVDIANKEYIGKIRKQIYDILSESEKLLQSNFSDSTANYKDELIKLKKGLYDAANSDSKLFGLITDENSYLYSVLGKGSRSPEYAQLFKVNNVNEKPKDVNNEVSLLDIDLSQSPPSNSGVIDSQIKNIEDILHDLNVIKTNKSKLIDKLKEEIHKDDISDILIFNCKIKSTNEIKSIIFPEELKKFNPFSSELDKLIDKQKTIIGNLKESWNKLISDPKVQEIKSSKEYQTNLLNDQIIKINQFYNENWRTYSEGLKKGVQIYNQMLRYAKDIKYKIENEHNSLQQQFSGMSVNNQPYGGATQPLYGGQSLGSESQAPNTGSIQPQFSGQSQRSAPPTPQQLQYSAPSQPHYIGTNFFSAPSPPTRQSTGGLDSNADKPPALPPKRPSQSGFQQPQQQQYQPLQQQYQPLQQQYQQPQHQQYQQPQQPQQYQPQQYQQPLQQQYQQPQHTQYQQLPQYQQPTQQQPPFTKNTNNGSNLIYDQPSTYQPNMYNFFSNNNP